MDIFAFWTSYDQLDESKDELNMANMKMPRYVLSRVSRHDRLMTKHNKGSLEVVDTKVR